MKSPHKAFSRAVCGAKTAVLFVHGILGSPIQFDFLLQALPENVAVENLLLPGHGQSVSEFCQSNWKLWQAHVDGALQRLSYAYENVFLVGHSMGCLLLLSAAGRFPAKVRGQLWIAPPFRMRITWRCLANNARVLFSKVDRNETIAAARKSNSISAQIPLAYLRGAPRFIELLTEGVRAKKHLSNLDAPVFAVYPENDEIVSRQSISCLKGLPGVQVKILRQSSHFYFPPGAKRALAGLLLALLAD